MTNADKFKSLFGLYATELWAMPEKDFLKWLNSEATNCSEFPNNSDTISRQAAIDALDKRFDSIPMEQTTEILLLRKDLRDLPSAQPEIIRCKDCRFAHMTYDGECKYCDIWFPDDKTYMDGDYFCASAERRTDE